MTDWVCRLGEAGVGVYITARRFDDLISAYTPSLYISGFALRPTESAAVSTFLNYIIFLAL